MFIARGLFPLGWVVAFDLLIARCSLIVAPRPQRGIISAFPSRLEMKTTLPQSPLRALSIGEERN